MDRITLHEELRLIERSESEVSTAWKGGHLLLFFLAFVFGSFCTFCFHMLMYLFDEKCVLFPKLLSLNSLRHNVIYEFIPEEKGKVDPLPVDFLSTQFVHKSACYLPTYVPLVSGIFGLVWTTMFLMCSSGSRALSGPQRPWRVILPVLVFSLAMSLLCIYSSAITHYGLQDLCLKLGEITGSTSCSYTVNVATLAYERQIRGVYQATRLTITSAWLHTACWVASTILAIVRIALAVDFRLVKIRAELIGDLDKMLEEHEEQLHTVMPRRWQDSESITSTDSRVLSYFRNKRYDKVQEYGQLIDGGSDILFISQQPYNQSDQGLLLEERNKSARLNAYETVKKEHRFVVNILYDILDSLEFAFSSASKTTTATVSSIETIARQFGQQTISSRAKYRSYESTIESHTEAEIEQISKDIKNQLAKKLETQLIELPLHPRKTEEPPASTSKKTNMSLESLLNIPQMDQPVGDKSIQSLSSTSLDKLRRGKLTPQKATLKQTVKDAAVQTEKKNKLKKTQKVQIKDDASDKELDSSSDSKKDKNIQTDPKEKQD